MAEEIFWMNRLGSALEQARTENKLVLAAFFSESCGPCRMMKELTLSSEKVREYIGNYFVPVKYESGADSEQFQRFDIKAVPTTVILDSAGNELFRKTGFSGPDVFMENLESVRGKTVLNAASP